MESQGRGTLRGIALGGTLGVHLAVALWLLRTGSDMPAPRTTEALRVIWIDPPRLPRPQAAHTPADPAATPQPVTRSAMQPVERARASATRPAMQAVELPGPDPAAHVDQRPSLQDQARTFARTAAPAASFDPDPLRHRPSPAPDGRFAMRDPLSAEDVVNAIGSLFGGGPSDPCPRIRANLANADMGAGRALAEAELHRLRRNCL